MHGCICIQSCVHHEQKPVLKLVFLTRSPLWCSPQQLYPGRLGILPFGPCVPGSVETRDTRATAAPARREIKCHACALYSSRSRGDGVDRLLDMCLVGDGRPLMPGAERGIISRPLGSRKPRTYEPGRPPPSDDRSPCELASSSLCASGRMSEERMIELQRTYSGRWLVGWFDSLREQTHWWCGDITKPTIITN